MSNKDDKADLSNLKSRLGLSEEEKEQQEADDSDTSQSSGSADASSTQSGGQATAATDNGSGTSPSSSRDSGGVEDRLAALRGDDQDDEAEAAEDAAAQSGGQAAQPGTGRGTAQSGGQARSPESSPGPDQGGAAAGAGQARQAAGGGPPAGQGPPPTAQGPPPTAQGPPQPGGGSSSAGTTSTDETDDVDVEDIDPDDINLSDFGEDESLFSGPIIGLLVVLLAVGLIFGFLMAETMQTRELEQTRINDAAQLQEELEPNLEDFDEAYEIIQGLDATDVDFEAAEQLDELEFTVNAGVLPGNRILLGEEIIRPLNRYMGESNVLAQLIAEHKQLTTGSDREELEAYLEDLDEIGEDEQLAAVFDVRGLRSHMAQAAQDEAEPQDYIPAAARLVKIPEDFTDLEPDEDGLVEVEVVASQAPDEVEITALVPIVDTDFLDIEPGNAMQRYGERIEQMQRYVDELEGTVPVLREEVDKVASADSPPLFTLTADDPAEEYMEEEQEDDVPDPEELLEEDEESEDGD